MANVRRALARTLLSLPSPILRLMSGGAAVYRGGRTLDPRFQFMAAQAARMPAMTSLSPEEARRATAEGGKVYGGRPEPGVRVEPLTIPAGERSIAARLYRPQQQDPAAPAIVFAHFGGGVIGDLTGFAASILKRGIDFIQIPTTLLSQVDSSVGGKTGINTPQGKNLVGTFYQPRLVLADTDVLKTLPMREFLAGYAEVVKYGLIADPDFFEWLESNLDALKAGDEAARIHAIETSCRWKAKIVAQDEREGGVRALLNLGHTFGHALEAATGFSSERLVHGESVSIGMVLAFELSAQLGLCPGQDTVRMRRHLERAGLPTRLDEVAGGLPGPDELIELMGHDKKAVDGKLTFILARGIGDAFITQDVSHADLVTVLAEKEAM